MTSRSESSRRRNFQLPGINSDRADRCYTVRIDSADRVNRISPWLIRFADVHALTSIFIVATGNSRTEPVADWTSYRAPLLTRTPECRAQFRSSYLIVNAAGYHPYLLSCRVVTSLAGSFALPLPVRPLVCPPGKARCTTLIPFRAGPIADRNVRSPAGPGPRSFHFLFFRLGEEIFNGFRYNPQHRSCSGDFNAGCRVIYELPVESHSPATKTLYGSARSAAKPDWRRIGTAVYANGNGHRGHTRFRNRGY